MADAPLNETQFLSLADIQKEQELLKKTVGNYFSLTVIEGRDFGFVFQVEKPETTIGRKIFEGQDDDIADIQIDDDRASRRHLKINKQQVGEGIYQIKVSDLQSKNGSYINGRRITSEVDLRHGDKLQVGNTVLKFEAKDRLEVSFHERIYQQVTRDPLTGLFNHNHVRHEMEKLISVGARHGFPFSMLMLEIDLFQSINDSYGNSVGDSILRTMAQILPAEMGDDSVIARYAGKQFLILLPETELKEAETKAESVRQAIESHDFSPTGCQQKITVSGSVAQFPVCGRTTEDLLKQADEALYLAKQIGGNRISVATVKEQELGRSWLKFVKWAAVLVVLVAVAMLSKFAYTRFHNTTVQKPSLFSGTVEVHEVQVGSKVGGRISEVLAQEGQNVKLDQVLVRLDIAELLAQRKQIEARIEQAKASLQRLNNGNRPEEIAQADAAVRREQANLEALRNGPRPQEIAQVKAELTGAESDLHTAEVSFQRIEAVFPTGYIAKQDRDDAENRVNVAKARVDSLRQRLSLLEAGTRSEEIRAAEERYQQALANAKLLHVGSRQEDIAEAQANLQQAEAALENLNVQIREGEVKSPADARIEVIDVRPGDLIAPGRTLAKLLERDQIWVRTYIPETELARVRVGQKASVTVDTFPNRKIPGYIGEINSEGEFIPRNIQTRDERKHQVFGVKVYVDDKNGLLKSGMSADVQIEE